MIGQTKIVFARLDGEWMPLLINQSFSDGYVHDFLKIARVCLVFKNGDASEIRNYRPISILPSFSKFFENWFAICNLQDCKITLLRTIVLTNNQFGLCSKHDASMAVIEIVDKISKAMVNSEYSAGIFIDLSKAFDTLDHHILFDKLEHSGIRGIALNWFKSYLTNRVQYIEYNNAQSKMLSTKRGVSQGSILEPILFLSI